MTLIVANWKMNGSAALAQEWVRHVAVRIRPGVEAVWCPPAVYLHEVPEIQTVKRGGQDCHSAASGAYTGDISAAMLKESGCAYVIVGHSERREHYHETDANICAKAERAIAAGLIPIICVGEKWDAWQAGDAKQVVAAQLAGSIPKNLHAHQYVIAYEPVWAIGSGKTPTHEDIHAMHTHITMCTEKEVKVLYGGSVKAVNAGEILKLQGVAGALVGGASLIAEEFCAILDSAAVSGQI